MRRFYGVLLTLLLGQALCSAIEPATPAEAKLQVEKIKQEIAFEEKAWSEEVAHEKAAEAKRKQRFSEFNQDKQHLQQSIAEQEAKLKALLAKMESHQFKERELQARFQQLSQVVRSQAQTLRVALALGLP